MVLRATKLPGGRCVSPPVFSSRRLMAVPDFSVSALHAHDQQNQQGSHQRCKNSINRVVPIGGIA